MQEHQQYQERLVPLVAREWVHYKKDSGNPANKIRGVTRQVAVELGLERPFIDAMVEHATALYYISTDLGTPEYHLQRALTFARRQGLTDQEIATATGLAFDIYSLISVAASSQLLAQGEPIAQAAIAELDRRRQMQAELQRREGVEKEKQRLTNYFERLMAYSDAELTIINSNPRIDSHGDQVYQGSNAEIRKRMQLRTLTRVEYEGILQRQKMERNSLHLSIRWIDDPELLLQKAQRLVGDHKVATLAAEQQKDFFGFIQALLSGQYVDKGSIVATGLDPDFVFSKARSVLRGHNLDSAERRRGNPRSLRDVGVFTRRGTNPNVFLGDGSERHALGYVQNQPKESD